MNRPRHVELAAIILSPRAGLTVSLLPVELSGWNEFAAIARATGARVGRMREVFR